MRPQEAAAVVDIAGPIISVVSLGRCVNRPTLAGVHHAQHRRGLVVQAVSWRGRRRRPTRRYACRAARAYGSDIEVHVAVAADVADRAAIEAAALRLDRLDDAIALTVHLHMLVLLAACRTGVSQMGHLRA